MELYNAAVITCQTFPAHVVLVASLRFCQLLRPGAEFLCPDARLSSTRAIFILLVLTVKQYSEPTRTKTTDLALYTKLI